MMLLVQGVQDLRIRQDLIETLARIEPGVVAESDRQLSHGPERLDFLTVLMQPRLALAARASGLQLVRSGHVGAPVECDLGPRPSTGRAGNLLQKEPLSFGNGSARPCPSRNVLTLQRV